MVNGFFAGGLAEGISSGRDQQLSQDVLSLKQREFESNEQRQLDAQVDKQIGETLRAVSEIVNDARAAGASPEKIQSLIAPLMQDVNDIASASGRDPSRFVNAVTAQINTPVPVEPSAEDKIREKVRLQAFEQEEKRKAGLLGDDKPEMTTGQKNELGRAEAAVKALTKEIDAFEELIKEEGAIVAPFTAAGDKVTGARRNIQLQLKELFNLGVLNGPDLALMDQLIPDPALDLNPVGDARVNIPFNIQERSKAALKQLRSQIKTVLDSKREAFTGSSATPNTDALGEAREAIAKGAPREAVIQRLRENGIDPSGL